ncbi:MAG: hypothetical protein IKZ37_01190 [Bacteroidaceae bacterium]|nr:hypothetical protein [Bacteroidaceae bacterium]
MKSKTKLLKRTAIALGALFAVSCSVDNAYDLSKEVDMTVAVGQGLTIPLGSTEKIMLTELLDTLDSDVIKIDKETGFYSIEKEGSIDATEFNVDDVDLNIAPFSESYVYDLNVANVDVSDLPPYIQDEILSTEYAYALYDNIDKNTISYEINQSVPAEIKGIKRMTFKENVKIEFDIEVTTTDESKAFNEFIDNIHLHTDGNNEEDFYIEMPSYLRFADNVKMQGQKLFLDEVQEQSPQSGVKHFACSFDVVAFDFSHEEGGYLKVENGVINIEESELKANGVLWSDTIIMAVKDLIKIDGVKITPKISFSVMKIDRVEGCFAPEIDPVESWLDIDLGDDLDNLNFEFTNPQLFLTVENGSPVSVNGNVNITGYKDGAPIENAEINTSLNVLASMTNKYYLSRLGGSIDGYTTVHIPDFNNLVKVVPDRLKVYFEPTVDDKALSTLQLGTTMSVAGSYELSVPMEFESFSLEYTERIENVLGDNSDDVTDYISDINSVTLVVLVDNTVPASFVPEIIAYKKDGVTRLDGIKVEVVGEILAGNGYENGRLTEPVGSEVAIRISAADGQLADLDILDFVVKGSGAGVLNANEYIQIKNISLRIDEPIEVDMN